MANSRVPSKVLRGLRRLNSAANTSAISSASRLSIADRRKRSTTTNSDDDIINLFDTKELFSQVSSKKLLKSAVTLEMSSFEPMVDFGKAVMNSKLMEIPLTKHVILKSTEHTFYNHFCAGKDLETAAKTLSKLWEVGLSAMLDYGLEHSDDIYSCDRNLEEFLRTIEWTKSLDADKVSFVVVKITAICPTSLLKRVSDLLRWEMKDESMNLPWKRNSFPIFAESSPLYHTMEKPEALTPDEERDLELAYGRLSKICDKALDANKPLLIDAEDTSSQPAIDYFTYSAAIDHTTGDEEPLIFNTVQAYLKDAKDRLLIAKKAADEMGVPIGFKLVRGAYMSIENKTTAALGVESPIHDSIQNTHACYNECADFLLEEIVSGYSSVVLATHNIDSSRLAAAKAVSLGIEKNHPCLQFAQLYGMSEALSFGLKNAGFRVSKYLPFGPVDQVIPYLLRRAEENRGLFATSTLDRVLMRKELLRRLRSRGS